MHEYLTSLINDFIGFELTPLCQFVSSLFPLLVASAIVSLIGRQKTLVWRCICVAYVIVASLAILSSNGVFLPFRVV